MAMLSQICLMSGGARGGREGGDGGPTETVVGTGTTLSQTALGIDLHLFCLPHLLSRSRNPARHMNYVDALIS